MNLSRIFRAREIRPNLRPAFCPETLEGRNLLSTLVAHPAADVQQDTQTVPMKGHGTGIISLANAAGGFISYTGSGNVSHLGRVTLTGGHWVRYTNGTDASDGDTIPYGSLTITAANGDKLDLTYYGEGTLISSPTPLPPGITLFNDTLHYTITGGTGRFAGATGKGDIHAIDGAPTTVQYDAALLPFSFDLRGVISSVGSGHGHSDGSGHGNSGD